MNIARVADEMLNDLVNVGLSKPNERLPKEEQIRCSIYAAMLREFDVVCAERGYASIDHGNRIECDLWASSEGSPDTWIEFKRCWSARGWVNKPPEQLDGWQKDVDKLKKLPTNTERYFFLVGVFDCDPSANDQPARNGVPQNIAGFHTSRLSYHAPSRPFSWRDDDGLNCISAWVWHWGVGVEIADVR